MLSIRRLAGENTYLLGRTVLIVPIRNTHMKNCVPIQVGCLRYATHCNTAEFVQPCYNTISAQGTTQK